MKDTNITPQEQYKPNRFWVYSSLPVFSINLWNHTEQASFLLIWTLRSSEGTVNINLNLFLFLYYILAFIIEWQAQTINSSQSYKKNLLVCKRPIPYHSNVHLLDVYGYEGGCRDFSLSLGSDTKAFATQKATTFLYDICISELSLVILKC